MTSEMHVLDWLPAYALGSLDEGENVQVEAHLASCAECRRELEAYRAVVAELPLAVPLREPPARLRQAILEKAGRSAAQRNVPKTATVTRQLPFWQRFRRSLASPVPTWGLVGALVVVIALLAINVLLLQRVASSPGNAFRVIPLTGTTFAPQASAWVVMSDDGRAGTLITEWLPPLKPDQQYQLWLMKDGKRSNGGVFSVDDRGYASMWVYTTRPLVDYKQFGVTIEPIGGSQAPTGSKVLGGSQ
jgi:anti-sigma-K factor RskA